jgi:hypothetical protein
MAEASLNKAHQALTYLTPPIFFNNHVLALHQVGRSLSWPDMPMGVEPYLPHSPSLPKETLQEEEDKTTKQD